MEIRELQADDKDQMLRLINDFLKYNRSGIIDRKLDKFEEIDNWNGIVEEEFEEYLNGIGFIAVENGGIIGFIIGGTEDRPNKVYKKRGMIQHFFVTEAERGKGIGTALYDKLISKFKETGCDCVSVDAYFTNTRTIKYYTNKDFIDWYRVFIKKI